MRRRRLEAEDEFEGERTADGVNAGCDAIDEDDDEVAELREIGFDFEAVAAASDDQEAANDDDEMDSWQNVRPSTSNATTKSCPKRPVSASKPVTEIGGAEVVELERGEEDDEERANELVLARDAAEVTQSSVKGMDSRRIKVSGGPVIHIYLCFCDGLTLYRADSFFPNGLIMNIHLFPLLVCNKSASSLH